MPEMDLNTLQSAHRKAATRKESREELSMVLIAEMHSLAQRQLRSIPRGLSPTTLLHET